MTEKIELLNFKYDHLKLAFFHRLMAYAGEIDMAQTEQEKTRIYDDAVITLSTAAEFVETARNSIKDYHNSPKQRRD